MPRPPPHSRFFVSDDDPPSKQSILQAALTLFVRNGIAGTSIRMIGAAAGYPNPAMFKFFDSKEALALYLFERCYGRLYGSVERATARGTFAEALAGVVDAFMDAMDEDLEAVLFVQDSLRELWPQLPPPARKRSILRLLRHLFERGVETHAVVGYGSTDLPVATLVGLMAQLARMLYFREVDGPARRLRGELDLALGRMLAP